MFARRSSRLIVVVEREPQRHWTDETPSRSWAPHDHGSSRYPSRYPRSGCQITRQTARRPRGTIIPSVLGASVTKFANSSGPMTILTSVTANAIWRVALTHSLAMLSAICSAKYPVWFWTPSNRPVLSLPKQRCSLKVHHPNKFRQTPPSQFCQFCDGRFLRPTLVHPPPLPIDETFLLEGSLKIHPGAPLSIWCLRHTRDSNETNPLRLCAAMLIYIAATPTTFYQRSHVPSAPDRKLESNSVFFGIRDA